MLDRLHEILRRILGRPENRNLPLWKADETSSPFAVPDAVDWLVRAGDRDRAELGHVLAGLMRKVGPHDWTRLYVSFRSTRIKPSDIPKLERLPADDAVEMLGVATLSTNGYTREAALRALGRLGHLRAVPYVLLRLSDWVEEVRQAAVATHRVLLDRGVAAQLIEHRRLIEHLRVVQRVDLSGLDAEIRERLRAPSSRPALESGLTADRAATRLFCLRMIESELRGQPRLLDRALNDKAPVVRSWIAARVAGGELDVKAEVFRSLLCDQASRVSTTMIRALSPKHVAAYRADLMELAMADALPVRESARFVLSRAESINFAAACRSRLDSVSRDEFRPGWVACLGETGDVRDFERVIGFLDHARSRLRAAAVTAVGRLDRARAAPAVSKMLADSSGHVRRASIAVLSEAEPALWIATANDILRSGAERAQAAALAVLTARGGWDSVPPLLRGLSTDSELLQQRAWQGIYDWHRRNGTHGWITPSPKCLTEISCMWPKVRSKDDAPDWAIGHWSSLRRWIDQLVGEAGR